MIAITSNQYAPVFLTNISEAVARKYNHCLWPKVTAVVASAHGKEESEQNITEQLISGFAGQYNAW